MNKRNKLSSSSVNAVAFDAINRRMFIKTAVGYMAIPFLSSLIPREALAQVAASPRRFIGIATSDQMPQQLLFPTGFVGKTNTAPYSTNTTAFQESGFNYSETILSSIISQNGSISGALDSKFNSFVSRMVMLGGLDFPGRLDHGSQGCMGNTANSNLGGLLSLNSNYTVDRVLARQSQIYSNATDSSPGMALRLGDKSCSSEQTGAGGRGQEVNTMDLSLNGNLNQLFSTYFKASAGTPGTTTTTGDATRKGILDQIFSSATSVRGSAKTSAEDKSRLDEYLQNLSDISKSLTPQTTTTPSGQSACPAVANDFTKICRNGVNDIATGTTSIADTTTYYKDVVRLITLFIKCDLCRVFNVGFASTLTSTAEAINFYTEPRPWHLTYGHGNNYPKLLAAQKWVLDNVVYQLMQNLNATESAETYLDNTLIYYSPEMSFGHSGINMGSLLIGDKRLNGGRALNYADYSKGFADGTSSYGIKMEVGAGQPINRLWVTMMQAYGISSSAYFGKYGSRSDTYGNWADYSSLDDFEAPFKTVQRAQLIGSVLPKVLK